MVSFSHQEYNQLRFRMLQVTVKELNDQFSKFYNLQEVLVQQQELTAILAYYELEIEAILFSLTDFPLLRQFLRCCVKDLDDSFIILHDFYEEIEYFDFTSFSLRTQSQANKVKELTLNSLDCIAILEENLED